MSIDIGVEVDPLDLRRLEQTLRGIRNGVPRTLSDAANHVRKKSVGARIVADEVRKELTIKSGTARKSIGLGRRATPARPSAVLKLRDKRLPNAYDFRGTRQTKKGLSMRFRKDEAKEVIRGSFRAKVGSGKTIGLTRYRTYSPRELYRGPRKGKTRAVTGPSVTGVATSNPSVKRGVDRRITQAFFKAVDYSARRLLAKHA
jgi:hypothetical protein